MKKVIKQYCEECDGSGKVHSHNPRCPDCDGKGWTKVESDPDTINRIQGEIADWAVQFGHNPSMAVNAYCYWGRDGEAHNTELRSIPPLLGMQGELGEISQAVCKHHQARDGFEVPEKYHRHLKDGIADLLIFACDWANREGISLSEALQETWNRVKLRSQKTWADDKARENDETNSHVKAPVTRPAKAESISL